MKTNPFSRRKLLLGAGVTGVTALTSGFGLAQTPPATTDTGSRRILDQAVDAFFDGWRTGNWKAFLALLADDFIFQFPAGPQRGRHIGAAGKSRITEWAENHSTAGNRITESTIDLRLYGENWIVICDRGSGRFQGQPYTGLHAIFMRAEGRKIAEFREYFGELPA
ncbi:MAG TPA: nuclear transport factor 2 family protein [Terrimicrobiaceae bacterium]